MNKRIEAAYEQRPRRWVFELAVAVVVVALLIWSGSAVETAEAMGVRADVGQVFTADQFYNDNPDAGAMYRKFGILALEMETAGLYWTAQRLGKRALSLLTISDHIFTGESLSAQERQDSFHEMMEIALETAWKSLEG